MSSGGQKRRGTGLVFQRGDESCGGGAEWRAMAGLTQDSHFTKCPESGLQSLFSLLGK